MIVIDSEEMKYVGSKERGRDALGAVFWLWFLV